MKWTVRLQKGWKEQIKASPFSCCREGEIFPSAVSTTPPWQTSPVKLQLLSLCLGIPPQISNIGHFLCACLGFFAIRRCFGMSQQFELVFHVGVVRGNLLVHVLICFASCLKWNLAMWYLELVGKKFLLVLLIHCASCEGFPTRVPSCFWCHNREKCSLRKLFTPKSTSVVNIIKIHENFPVFF